MSRANKFVSRCVDCGGTVGAGEGFVTLENKKWKTRHAPGKCIGAAVPVAEAIKLDSYQQKIFDAIQTGATGPNIMVNAKAGTGKTTVQCLGVTSLHKRFPDLSIICLAFGNADGKRLRERLPPGVDAMTTHSFCMSAFRKKYKATLNKGKMYQLLDEVVPPGEKSEEERAYVAELVAKIHADAVLAGDHAGYDACIESYGVDMPNDAEGKRRIFKYVDKLMKKAEDFKKYGFSFDEALYFVAIKDIPLPEYDFVGVDECQDFNRCQLMLLEKFAKSGARLMAVGDPNQSLFMFRGAQPDSFEQVAATLHTSERGAVDYLMPYCRRCAQSVIRRIQSIVPDIKPLPGAPEGSAHGKMAASEIVEQCGEGDMIICRTNAPLVRLAWQFIKLGKKFYMRGGDQEAMLLKWYVDLFASGLGKATTDISTMLDRARQWLKEREGMTTAYKLAEHQERIEVIQLIAERSLDVPTLKKEIDKLFKPPADLTGCVVLSTIHRAKGSESRRVIHLMPELVPHKLAKSDKEKAQELNAIYVAGTRAIETYVETAGELAAA